MIKIKSKIKLLKHYCALNALYRQGIVNSERNRSGKKTLIFLIDFPQSWNAVESVYNEALLRDDLNVRIIAIPQLNADENPMGNIAKINNAAYTYLTDIGIDAIKANKDDNTWFQVDELNPSYIVYTRPYNAYYPDCYRSYNLCRYSKVFYVPYAYGMLGNGMISHVLPDNFAFTAHRIFFANKSRMDECIKKRPWYKLGFYKRLIYVGFPRFDQLERIKSKNATSHKKTVVAWMPRWAADESNTDQKASHFLTLYKSFLDYFGNNDEFSLIIRPHPLMFKSYVSQNIMTSEEVDEFRRTCEKANIQIDEKKDCFATISESDVLVADYTSLIAEFFMTEKPIIFCDTADGLNPEGRQMCDSLYHADSFEDIKRYLNLIKGGNDEGKNRRLKLISELLPNKTGEIGKRVLEIIMNS